MASSTRDRRPRPADRPLRALLYYRRSSEMQADNFSLDAQRRACRDFCRQKGWEIAGEYIDDARSGRSADLSKRPEFRRMIEAAEAGAGDVIVVHKLDRFARNLIVTMTTLERLNACGVSFVSISEQMDFTTATGKMLLSLLASFAQFYSDNLSAEFKKGKAERKRQGFYNGLLPFGAVKGDDELPAPDPANHAGLILAFTLAADGASDRAVAEALNAAGFRTTGNRGRNLFSKDTVTAMLQNRFYVGELPDGEGGWLPAKHAPLLDADLFERAQAARAHHRRSTVGSVRADASVYSLSGLAHCRRCGGRLRASIKTNGPRLTCATRQQQRGCDAPSASLTTIEAEIGRLLAELRPALDAATVRRAVAAALARPADDLAKRRRELAHQRERLLKLYQWGDLTDEQYAAARKRLDTQLAALPAEADDAAGAVEAVAAYLRDLARLWADADAEERNRLLRLLTLRVEVADGGRRVALVLNDEAALVIEAACQPNGLTDGSDGIWFVG